MKWTPECKQQLEQMFNDEKSDFEIARHFGIGTMAVAKERSVLGLVHFHRKGNVGVKRIVKPIDTDKYVLSYEKDGKHHFSNLGNVTQQKAESLAVLMVKNNDIKDVSILTTCSYIKNGSILCRKI